MSPTELEEHRSKNLCFFCLEKCPGHNCPQRQTAQVFFMETVKVGVTKEGLIEAELEEEINHEEQQTNVTLNSFMGNVSNDNGTMRIKGMMGNKTIHILLDTGSSHNFLSNRFENMQQFDIKTIQPLKVTIADGEKIHGLKMIEKFTWVMQGHEFSAGVILFPLVGCDMILGMKWLRTLGTTMRDCVNLTIEFMRQGQRIKITSNDGIKNQLP